MGEELKHGRLRLAIRKAYVLVFVLLFVAGTAGTVLVLSGVNSNRSDQTRANSEMSGGIKLSYTQPENKVLLDASPSTEEMIIYISDAEGKPITGKAFQVVLSGELIEDTLLVDADMDGTLLVEKPKPGQYEIRMLHYSGFQTPESVTVTVEEPVAHIKVDVSGKIKKQNEVDLKNDDSQYSGGSHQGEQGNDDTVEYVDSNQEEIGTETVQKDLKDSNGNQLYGSVPRLSEVYSSGYRYMYDASGEETWIRATVDEKGYLLKAEERQSDGSFVECTYSVINQYGYPMCDDNGNYLYQFESVNKLTTTEEQTVYKYTGWQVLDGKTYYFDRNGNKVKGLQVINGLNYYFDNEGVRTSSMGIDVSTWNDDINWNKVKAAGVDFVIIRCGFRGYGSGALVQDNMYESHIKGALRAGLKVGVYFFTQAISETEAVEEASMCLDLVSGYKITYPIFIDIEDAGSSSARTNKMSNAQRTAVVNAFCDTIRAGGYTAGVYANKHWLESKLNTSQFSSRIVVWLAHYTGGPRSSYSGRYEMWQYTSVGSINGIPGDVDVNIGYLGY